MKILQVCAVDFTLHHFLVPLISELRGRDHDVVVACAEGPFVRSLRSTGLRIEPIPFSRNISDLWGHVCAYRALRSLLRNERFDIIQVHTPIAAAIGRLAAWKERVPTVVYTAHGFYFHDKMWFPKRLMFLSIEWFLGRFTDVLFTQSKEDAVTAQRFGLCKTGRIKAIGNGVDPKVFYPALSLEDRKRRRLALGAEPETCVIMMVGRLVVEKGYRELFSAMEHLDAELWVVGEHLPSDHAGGIEKDIDRVLKDDLTRDKIKFLGRRDDVPDLLRAADIFVLPSHREGMPRSIIEAMMTGLPVVATDIRGSREEVCQGLTGFLVDVGVVWGLRDALDTLVNDGKLRHSMGHEGFQRARELFDESSVLARQIDELSL